MQFDRVKKVKHNNALSPDESFVAWHVEGGDDLTKYFKFLRITRGQAISRGVTLA